MFLQPVLTMRKKKIPELQELYKEMKRRKGVGVAGVVLDTTDEKGNQDEEAVKKAGILQEKTKAEYPFLIPDTTMMNGRLQGDFPHFLKHFC